MSKNEKHGVNPSTAMVECGEECGCGLRDCDLGTVPTVDRSGYRYLTCIRCGSMRLPPALHLTDTVETDSPIAIGPILRTLFGIRMRWLRRSLPYLGDRHLRVLDVGCGDGQFLHFLAKKGYESLMGVERNPARRKNAQSHDISVLPDVISLGDHRYDLIVLWHVLEHVDRPMELIPELTGHLAKDGILLVSIPNHEGWTTRLFGKYSCYLDYGRHVWYWDRNIIDQIRDIRPDLEVTELAGRNIEYEMFAWLDSLVSWLFRTENAIHRRIKKNTGTKPERLVAAIAAVIFLPFAMLMAFATPVRAASTLTFQVRTRTSS